MELQKVKNPRSVHVHSSPIDRNIKTATFDDVQTLFIRHVTTDDVIVTFLFRYTFSLKACTGAKF